MSPKKIYNIAITVIITASLSFMTASAFYNGKLFIKPGGDARLNSVISVLDEYYYEDYNKDKAYDAALKGYVKSLGDPYTEYMTQKELEEFNELINSSYCGIGVTVQNNTEDNTLLIIDVFENSPAANAGIEAGDIITKVKGVAYKGEQLEDATNNIQGEEGTDAEVTILKKSTGKEVDLTITRKSIQVDSVASEIIDNNIGYVAISQFATNTALEFTNQLDELMKQGITSLIIDVRNNGGGITTAVEAVADCILEKDDVIYYTADKHNNKHYVKSKIDGIDLPVVVLANENSASASEILVGAVKDNNRGVIVGKKTYGKGVVQQLITLTDNTAVKVTVEKYFTPNGNYIHEKGIEPDYAVELDGVTDTQLEKAIEILKNQ